MYKNGSLEWWELSVETVVTVDNFDEVYASNNDVYTPYDIS
jgi:hypothetical protein